MALKDIYNEQTKENFVKRVAKLTKKSPKTVKGWIHAGRVPDALTRSILAKEFGVNEDELFPEKVKADEQSRGEDDSRGDSEATA